MTKGQFRQKTALILGADTPAGRSVALKFSRLGSHVVISGFDEDSLELLARLIRDKGGDPVIALLPEDRDGITAELREKRSLFGHYHAIVNATAASSYHGDARRDAIDRSHLLADLVRGLASGRGSLRFFTIWPDDAGEEPQIPPPFWHSLIRVSRVAGMDTGTEEETEVRPAAVAEALAALLQCDPSACPVEVRLEPRQGKV